MSQDAIKINVVPRSTRGSANARRLRRQGVVPAVLYGADRVGLNVQLSEHDFAQMLRHHASESLVVDLAIDKHGETKALLKEVQHHPLTGQVVHVDFQEISMTQKIKVDVAVELVNVPVGVSQGGGVLDSLVHSIEVECLPGDLIEKVEVDVSDLDIGQHRTVGEIQVDSTKISIITASEIAVANVLPPKVSTDESVGAGAGEVDAPSGDPVVLTEKSTAEKADG